MHAATYMAFLDELQKEAKGILPPALSMGGLAGLTAIEGAGALDKKKSKGERIKSGLGAGATGAILASEAMEHKDLLHKGFQKAKSFIPRMGKVVHASVGSHVAAGAGGLLAGGAIAGHFGHKRGRKKGAQSVVGAAIKHTTSTPEYKEWTAKAKPGDRFQVGIGHIVKDPPKAKTSMVSSALSIFQEKTAMDMWNPSSGRVFGEAASKVRSMASAAPSAASGVKADPHKMLAAIRGMKSSGRVGTLAAGALKKASINKEALFGLGGAAKAVAKAPFKPSFAGHGASMAKALKATTAANGVTTAKAFNPMSKAVSSKKFLEIPGLT